MNPDNDLPPAVILKSQADFATPAAWEADLIERVTDRLSWVVNHPRYPSMYEVDQDVHLKTMDAKELDHLLLGQVFHEDIENHDRNSHYLHDQDVQVIKEDAPGVFKIFAVEIEALAEATGREVEEIHEQWLDSEEFEPGEMECHVHHMNYRYRDEVAARVDLPFNLTLDTNGDDLWSSLEFFRINPSDFLAAAQKDISDLAADFDGKVTEKSLENLQKWSFSSDDIQESDDDEDPVEQNAEAIYTAKFVARLSEVEALRLCTLNKWAPGDSAITPQSLIEYVKAQAYGAENSISTYLHLCLDEDTISGFSTRCARHDFHSDQLPVTVLSGYLSGETYPGYDDDNLGNVRLVKPVTVALGTISIDQSNSPEKGADTLLMPADLEMFASLHEILCVERRSHSPLDLSHAEDQACLERALAVIEGQPRLTVLNALSHGNLAGFQPHAKELLARTASMFDQDELDRELVAKLESLTRGSITKVESMAIERLITAGARGDFQNSLGAHALHLASERLVPLPLLNAIGQVTDQLSAEIHGRGNAFEISLKSLSFQAVPWKDDAKQELTQHLAWFLDHGIGLTSRALNYPKPGPLTDLMRVDDGPMVVAALNQLASVAPDEDIQRVKDRMFYEAALGARDELAGSLLAAGARVDAFSRSLKKPCSIEEAVDQFGIKNTWDRDLPIRVNAIKAMARSARLRTSAMSLIEEMENDVPAPATMRP